jgi:hypothetical protein
MCGLDDSNPDLKTTYEWSCERSPETGQQEDSAKSSGSDDRVRGQVCYACLDQECEEDQAKQEEAFAGKAVGESGIEALQGIPTE